MARTGRPRVPKRPFAERVIDSLLDAVLTAPPAANLPISAHDDAASATGSIFASFLPSARRAICRS